MTPSLLKIQPTPKSEEWRFVPKGLFTDLMFTTPDDLTLENFRNSKLAVGPDVQKFETLSIGELEDEGYITIEETPQKKTSDANTKRAVLDDTTFNLFEGLSTFKVTFLKRPPSNLWISAQTLRLANFHLTNNANLNLCIFETEPPETTSHKTPTDGFLINFELDEGCQIELGLCLNSSKPSLSQVNITSGEKSEAHIFSFLSGETRYKRLEVNLFKNGASSKTSLQGLCFAKEDSVLDFHSNIFHSNKDQETLQIYKSICSNKSKSIFRGRVHLTESAKGANVNQLNKSLLLDKTASVDSQPELNIYQDDVKATHGATTSSIDKEHLFYFSSRGFKPEQSKKMLISAFCKSSLSNLSNSGIKSYFLDALEKEFTKGLKDAH